MRKQWLIPIIATIGNFFSVIMMWIFPLLIVAIIISILKLPETLFGVIAVLLIFGYPIYLFYLGASGKGEKKAKTYFPSRALTAEEEEILVPMVNEVLDRHNKISNTNWIYGRDIQFTINEDDSVNAFAIGKTHIMFNSGIFKILEAESFKATLAHEIGHLYHKDTLIGLTNFLVQIPTQIVLNIFNSYKVMGHLNDAARQRKGSGDKAITNLMFKLFFLPALLIGTIVNFICNTTQKILSKQQEFAADQYACKLGYADGLIELLQYFEKNHVKANRLVSLFETHPAPKLRIAQVKLFSQKQTSASD